MKKRINKRSILIAMTVAICAANIATVSASGFTGQKSQGRIIFDNSTPDDTSDDVIFDAADFEKLYEICK